MNVMRASSLQKESERNKKSNNYCPLLHSVTLLTTYQTKKLSSLQEKINESLQQLKSINIEQVNKSSFMVLLQSYNSHLQGSENVKTLVQILCQKLNRNANTQILISLLEILAKQYNLRGEKDQQIKVMLQIFELGLGMKSKKFNTFNFGVRACELMPIKQFQKNVNNVIAAIRNQIQSNTHTLTQSISLASQVYGSKITTKQDKKDKKDQYSKQNKNQYMRKLMHRSSSQHKKSLNQHNRPVSPNMDMRLSYYQDVEGNMEFSNTLSLSQQFGQKNSDKNLMSQQIYKPFKIMHSKTIHKANPNDITMKIKTKIKSKSQLLPFYILLYESYTICLLRIKSQLKKKYYKQARTELKEKIMREYPGRNIQQMLFEIQLDKLKIYQQSEQKSNKSNKQPMKLLSPSSNLLLKKGKLSCSSSAGKLSLNMSNSPTNKGFKQNKSTFSYEMNQFQQSTQSQFVEKNSSILGVKRSRPKVSKFNTNRQTQQNNQNQQRIPSQEQNKIQKNKQSSRKNIRQSIDDTLKQSTRERKPSIHIRSRILSSSKSEQRQSRKQIKINQQKNSQITDSGKSPLLNINRAKKDNDDKKSSILQKLKLNENKQKVNLKKKAKQLIQQKNFLKLNDFTKTSNNSQRNSVVNDDEIKDDTDCVVVENSHKQQQQQNVDNKSDNKVAQVQEIVVMQTIQGNKQMIQSQQMQQQQQQQQIKQKTNIQHSAQQQQQKQKQQQDNQFINTNEQHYCKPQLIESIQLIVRVQKEEEEKNDNNDIQVQSCKKMHLSVKQQKGQNKYQCVEQNNHQLEHEGNPFFRGIEQDVQYVSTKEQDNDAGDLQMNEIVTAYLENQLSQNVINSILSERHQYQNLINQQQSQLQYPHYLKLQKQKKQRQLSSYYLFPKKTQQQTNSNDAFVNDNIVNVDNEQNDAAVISDRRIPLYDLSYQRQSSKQQQTVYEIMIKDTPMNGHDLYSSTSRSAKQSCQQNSSSKIQNAVKQSLQYENMLTQSKKKTYLLQIPKNSDSEQDDFIQQRRINESNFLQNQIQVLHGFGIIREMEISVLNYEQQQMQQFSVEQLENEQVQRYFRVFYENLLFDQDVQNFTDDVVNQIHQIQNDQKQLQKNDLKPQDQLHDNKDDVDHVVSKYMQSLSIKLHHNDDQNYKGNGFILDAIDQNNDRIKDLQENCNNRSFSQQLSSQSSSSSSSKQSDYHQSNNNNNQYKTSKQQIQPHNISMNTETNNNYIDSDPNLNYLYSNIITDQMQSTQNIIENNKNLDQILTVENNICSLLNATAIQYSQTSKLNITEFSPVMPQKKFPPSSQHQKQYAKQEQEISIFDHTNTQGEGILDIRPSQLNRNSIQDDLVDMAQLVKHRFINSNHNILSSNINVDVGDKKGGVVSNPIINVNPIISENNINTNCRSKHKRQNSKGSNGQKKVKNVQINLMPRQETIESNISSNQQSHSIIVAHHLLKPQIHVSETLVRLTVFHPEEKKTCQVEKVFLQPINIKDYLKGLQARTIKFLDKLVIEAKQQQKSMLQSRSMYQSTRLNSQSLKRSRKQQQLQRSRVDDLINHGHHPFNWQYIVENIKRVNLQQQLFNLKSFRIPYKKDQYLTLSLMHYVDYKRLIVEYKKNPLELRPVQISLDLNQSINEITSLFNENNVNLFYLSKQTKIELTQINNQIKPILQVYNLWCHLQTLAISLKNSTSRLKSLFKLNQFVFKTNQNITKYNMLIQMIHSQNEKENLVISDMNLHDRNKLVNNFSVVVGYAVKIDRGKSKFTVGGKEVKTFLTML